MKNLFLIFCLLFSGYLFAQIPAAYYNTAFGKKGYQLRIALHAIIDNHNVLSSSPHQFFSIFLCVFADRYNTRSSFFVYFLMLLIHDHKKTLIIADECFSFIVR